MKTYVDKVKCPLGHKFSMDRRITTAGRKVRTYCRLCQKPYALVAGPAPVARTHEALGGQP